MGEVRCATGYFEQSLTLVRESGEPYEEAGLLWEMGLTLRELGYQAEGLARAEEALALLERMEDPRASTVREQVARWHAF